MTYAVRAGQMETVLPKKLEKDSQPKLKREKKSECRRGV